MKKIFTLSFVALVIALSSLKAQTFQVSDLNSYINAYTAPFAKSIPVALSGGWAHTAKVHGTLGFDVTLGSSLVFIPTTEGVTKYTDISLPNGFTFTGVNANGDVPTIRGESGGTVPRINYDFGDDVPTLTFDAFNGIGLGLSAAPYLQFGFGLPKGTELIGRFIPDVSNIANSVLSETADVSLEKTGLWGIGVKHDIKQWIPVVSKVPFLQISGLVSFTKFYTGFSGGDLAITPTVLGISNGSLASNTTLWDNQNFSMKASSFSGSLLVGASIPVFQPFIGLGFNSGKFESGLYGTYPIVEVEDNDLAINNSEEDPLVVEQKFTNFNFQAGARLKLGPIVFHYAMSMQKYTMHTFGLAVTLR
jgi:hypothetical protein